MTARQLIEAEDPKQFLMQRNPQCHYEALKALLVPLGWTPHDQLLALVTTKEVHMPATKGRAAWRLSTVKYLVQVPRRGNVNYGKFATLTICHTYSTGHENIETLQFGSMEYLLRHLKLFRLIEAEDPKAFFLNHIRPVSLEQLERVLRPYGFRMQSVGINELWKEKGGRRYSLSSNVDPAKINFCTYHGYGGGRWQLDDLVPLAIDGLMLRLKHMGLVPPSVPDSVVVRA